MVDSKWSSIPRAWCPAWFTRSTSTVRAGRALHVPNPEGGRHQRRWGAHQRGRDGEYGLIFFPLTTSGSATPKDALAAKRMPVADSKGRVNYERTFPAAMLPAGLLKNLSSMHVVEHGIDYNHNGKYDLAALGESTFAKNQGKPGVPEEMTDPAACGVVEGAAAAAPARHGAEMGGLPAPDVNAPLLGLGAALLVASSFALSTGVRLRGRRHGK